MVNMLSTKNTGMLLGSQGKKRPPPPSIQIRQNVRIEDRVNTTLGPSDPKYQEMEKYFATLLEDMDWTIARILHEHFSPHEAKKFTPTREPPWAEWQADDTRAFEKLLQTRFKGVRPTLSMKLALLYHGFAVAPMKIGPIQDAEPRDYQHFIKRENRVIQDPLTFLEGYTERTWGETPPQLPFQPPRVPPVTEAMGLRGGALDDADMEDIMSEEEPHGNTGNAGRIKPNASRVLSDSLFVHPRRTPYAGDKKVMDKNTQMYNSQAEFRTGSGTDGSMRKQAWWAPPSIFANPLKPVMPLHAAPLETVIKTGPSVPSVSLGLRTSTEMARLEREVHMLRGHLLGRNRECPYHDCHRFFHYLDTKSFEDHLTQEHAILRCTLCLAFPPAQKHAGVICMDRKHIIKHIVSEHTEQLKAFIALPKSYRAAPPQPPVSTRAADPMSPPTSFARLVYPFCDRCGRDNLKCCESEDIKNHRFRCTESDGSLTHGSPLAYCESCGTKTGSRCRDGSCRDKKCASHNPNSPDDERFCRKCGLCWNDNHSEVYKAQHASGCRFPGGTNGSFCVYCGDSLRGLDAHGVEEHSQQVCATRPKPGAEGGPSKAPVVTSSSSSGNPNIDMATSEFKTGYPWLHSSKRPTADPQGSPRPVKKRRQTLDDSDSELSSGGSEFLLTGSDEDSEESPAEGASRKALFLKRRGPSAKPPGEAFGTQTVKQEEIKDTLALQTSQQPAPGQGSAAEAATAVQPRTTQCSATPAASTAKAAGTGAAQAAGAPGTSYPWCGGKAQSRDQPTGGGVEATTGGPSGGEGAPAAATPSAAVKTEVSPPESGGGAAAVPQGTPATTRSGRTVLRTRAAAELLGKAANANAPAARKGRPKKRGGR